MRYWIWWNDLIQGPFEFDELVLLRAFSEDLLVCMEDRTDWLPAGRVADLSSAVEQWRSRRAAPLVPPPPPPKRPPTLTPLQGEFFGESQDQQTFFDSNDTPKGPFAYRPVTAEPEGSLPQFLGQATMPFHFSHQAPAASAVIEMLRPTTARVAYAPQPVIKQSAIPKEVLPREEEKIEEKPFISLELLQEKPSQAPSFDSTAYEEKKLEWLPWILGVVLALAALGTMGYWLMDRVNTHSAIAEANRLEPPKPMSIPSASAVHVPVTSASAPVPIPVPTPVSVQSNQAKQISPHISFFSSVRKGISHLFSQSSGFTPSQTVDTHGGAGTMNSAGATGESAKAKETPHEKSVVSSMRQEVSHLLSQLANVFSTHMGRASQSVGGASGTINQEASAASAGNQAKSAAAPDSSQSQTSEAREESGKMSPEVARVRKLAGAPEISGPAQLVGEMPPASAQESAAGKEETPAEKSVVSSVRKEIGSLLSQLANAFSILMGRTASSAGQVSSAVTPAVSAVPSEAVNAASGVSGALSVTPATSESSSIPTKRVRSSKSKLKKAAMKLKAKPKGTHRNQTAAEKANKSQEEAESSAPIEKAAGKLPGVTTAETKAEEGAGTAPASAAFSAAKRPSAAVESDVASVPGVAAVSDPTTDAAPSNDPWKRRANEAIALVMAKKLPKSKVTIGDQARTMLQEMHEKELMHAAETGERLYLPDKLAWAALQEEGPHYRVYLNFLSWQASGERIQSRSYQFLVDLKTKEIHADDPATQQDLLTQPAELTFKHNPMATDIDSILGGVDTYNKHKVQLIIVKKNGRNRDERKKMETAEAVAEAKVRRAIIFFRRTYTEKALQNIAKAYEFMELLKG